MFQFNFEIYRFIIAVQSCARK